MQGAQGYRADIDGLRALAVLPVVAFHLGFRPVAGGYVGVDVFFVISGYLIGRIVLSETRAKTFSLRQFYARRARRIFPALFAMFAATTAAACVILYPSYLLDFAKSMAAAAVSGSNFYFWATADYFDAPVETKPLLHTWSLAVEEQFYIFLPLAAMALARANAAILKAAFGSVFIASFAWAAYAVSSGRTSDAFYLPHLRAWELLLGVLAAVGLWPKLNAAWMRHAAALIGLPLIIAPIFLYHAGTPFPGLSAAAPCIGTALMIAAGEHGDHLFSRIMRFGPVVFFGLISYSLYLWHWPIITLYQQYSGVIDIPWPTKLALGAASILVSAASWRWIERPFRRASPNPNPALIAGGAAITLTVAVSIALIAAGGLPNRFSPEARRIATYLDVGLARTADGPDCMLRASERESFSTFDRAQCLRFDDAKRNVLVFGDSHAEHLVPGLRAAYPDVNFLVATASQCAPLLGHGVRRVSGCEDLVRYVYDDLVPDTRIDRIIIAARWSRRDMDRMDQTFARLATFGRRIVIVGPAVQYDAALPYLIVQGIQRSDPGLPARHVKPWLQALDAEMQTSAERRGLTYRSIYRLFCDGVECRQRADDGVPMQYDYGHMTREGSTFAAQGLFDGDLGGPTTASP